MEKFPKECLIFEPILKRILWGGRRLETLLGKKLGKESDYAESWEVADHAQGVSKVVSPPELEGRSLAELIREFPREIFGEKWRGGQQFPLLIKFLDAHQVLSLQVHPDDELGRQLVNDNGKNEAWVIIHAEPGSLIYAGLKPGVTREMFEQAMAAGTVSELVHSFEPRPGDCIMIPAGTVHAIGSGIVLAEVQQMSDATFRVDDWGRTGTDGKPRQLHLREALLATDFHRGPVNPCVPETLGTDDGQNVHELLVRNRYFCIDRWRIEKATSLGKPAGERFTIVMVVEGDAEIETVAGGRIQVTRGTTVLVPASVGMCQIRPVGKGRLSVIECWVPS